MKYRVLLSNIGLLVVMAVGLTYILLGVVRINPTADPYTVTVNLANSGGLLDRSEVTYRGHRVGKIGEIRLRPGGVAVDVLLDEGTQIPADTDVLVAGLSAAGEQYLDFRPRTDAGPFLAGGSVVDEQRTATPTPFAELLVHLNDFGKQIDPRKLDVVVTELAAAFDGTGPQLARILDGSDYLLAGLEDALPETVSLFHNGRIVLNTVADLNDELSRLTKAGTTLGTVLRESDPEIRTLLDNAPGTLELVDDLLKKNGPTMAALLVDLATVSEVVSLRLPAIGTFLPALTDLGALTVAARGGAVQVVTDLYPKPACDYHTPRRPPTIGGSPPPLLYVYCTESGPMLQQRGSYNAPRPPGDDTAGPPSGVSGNERARSPSPGAPRVDTAAYGQWFDDYLALIAGKETP
jgi:phospholipid/cholesterol/gamma-HCH transport system substrate-binding protein